MAGMHFVIGPVLVNGTVHFFLGFTVYHINPIVIGIPNIARCCPKEFDPSDHPKEFDPELIMGNPIKTPVLVC